MKLTVTLLAGILLPLATIAQDDHPWSQQYGAVSTLMGGAMVAGVRDNSAVYYNPGAMQFISFPSLSVDANVYKVDQIFIDDGAGNGVNLNSMQLSIYPQIVSGLVTFRSLPRWRFSYALLTRNYNNVLMNTRYTSESFEVNPIPEHPNYVGAFDFNNQLNEQWFTAGTAYKVNENFGIGMNLFVSYRAKTYQKNNFFRAISLDDSVYSILTINDDQGLKYRTFGVLAKFGLAYEKGRWRLGLTVTTPSVQVYGWGDAQREFSIYYVSENMADTAVGFIVMDRKTSVRFVQKHPLSVAAGVEYNTGKTRLAFSMEYFTGVKTYNLTNAESTPFVYPPEITDSANVREILSDFLNYQASNKQIVNFALGFEQQISDKFFVMLGAHTDFDTYREIEDGKGLTGGASWDLYHLSAGLSYKRERQMITAGIRYSFSPSMKISPYAVLSLEDDYDNATVSAQSFAFVLGYTYFFPK